MSVTSLLHTGCHLLSPAYLHVISHFFCQTTSCSCRRCLLSILCLRPRMAPAMNTKPEPISLGILLMYTDSRNYTVSGPCLGSYFGQDENPLAARSSCNVNGVLWRPRGSTAPSMCTTSRHGELLPSLLHLVRCEPRLHCAQFRICHSRWCDIVRHACHGCRPECVGRRAPAVADTVLTHVNMNDTGRLPHFGLYHASMEVQAPHFTPLQTTHFTPRNTF